MKSGWQRPGSAAQNQTDFFENCTFFTAFSYAIQCFWFPYASPIIFCFPSIFLLFSVSPDFFLPTYVLLHSHQVPFYFLLLLQTCKKALPSKGAVLCASCIHQLSLLGFTRPQMPQCSPAVSHQHLQLLALHFPNQVQQKQNIQTEPLSYIVSAS